MGNHEQTDPDADGAGLWLLPVPLAEHRIREEDVVGDDDPCANTFDVSLDELLANIKRRSGIGFGSKGYYLRAVTPKKKLT
jgi:hypothetical protein